MRTTTQTRHHKPHSTACSHTHMHATYDFHLFSNATAGAGAEYSRTYYQANDKNG